MTEGTDTDWIVIRDVEAFRRVKRRARGVVVIRGSASTTIHHPDCPHAREDAFLEKLRNDRLAYHWTRSVEEAQRRWPSARVCRHPSEPLAGGTGGPEARTRQIARTGPLSGDGWSVDGPSPTLRAVRADTDFVLPYEPRTGAQRELRAELRERLRRLACRDDEVLHASFFGDKPDTADVENLLLYNVDDSGRAFAGAERGVRFEGSPRPMPGAPRSITYLYRPVKRSAGFALWDLTHTIARWDRVTFERPLDRVALWLAFRGAWRGQVGGRHAGVFGVRVLVRPGASASAGVVRLVKPMLDAIVAALQAHADGSTIREASARLAIATGGSASMIERLLADTSGAVLGVVPRLVHLRGQGIQLSPDDQRCVAAEVLLDAPSTGEAWEAGCEVVAVTPRRPVRGTPASPAAERRAPARGQAP